MVELDRIYTRGGDKGKTSLGGGMRVSKDDRRVEAYGLVDEANSALGVARLYLDAELDPLLERIQNDLFDLGADLATPLVEALPYEPVRIQASQTLWLEAQIDSYNAGLTPLKSFVLPGGTPAASHLHMARTILRRAERAAVSLAAKEEITSEILRYLNRSSDFCFVLARYVNHGTSGDVLWQPKQNQ